MSRFQLDAVENSVENVEKFEILLRVNQDVRGYNFTESARSERRTALDRRWKSEYDKEENFTARRKKGRETF